MQDREEGLIISPKKASSEMLIVDLGRHSRKRIRKLREGNGRLMREVNDALQRLTENGELAAGQGAPVVVVVREKPRKSQNPWW